MRTPGWHRDTYVEEYHRHFFTNLARGKKPRACGVEDVHIGGLVPIVALWAALPTTELNEFRGIVREHVGLTHRCDQVLAAADGFVRVLFATEQGGNLRQAIVSEARDWCSERKASVWALEPDEVVVGERLSPACYIEDAFPASLYLAWKYAGDFDSGIIANANVGGDNCHRGAVVGALLGAVGEISSRWIDGLVSAAEIGILSDRS
jgi:ADP-ribosylglycohydrolase